MYDVKLVAVYGDKKGNLRAAERSIQLPFPPSAGLSLIVGLDPDGDVAVEFSCDEVVYDLESKTFEVVQQFEVEYNSVQELDEDVRDICRFGFTEISVNEGRPQRPSHLSLVAQQPDAPPAEPNPEPPKGPGPQRPRGI